MSTTLSAAAHDKMRGSLTRATGPRIKITKKDLKLFTLLLDFRLMDANQICIWLGCDTQGKRRSQQRRLKHLFDKPNAYIDRVQSGNYFIEGGGSEPTIYSLNNKGRKALIESNPKRYSGVSERIANTTLKPNFVQHTLFNSEIATHINEGCRSTDDWIYAPRDRFYDEQCTDALKKHPNRHPNNYYGWPVSYHVEKRDTKGNTVVVPEVKTLVPDYFSCVVNKKTRAGMFFFTEADNSTEPIERGRGKLLQSDVWSKLILYNRSATQQLYKKFYNLESDFRILFVTLTDERVNNMVAANKDKAIRDGQGWEKFLFTTREALNVHGFLDAPWRNGRNDQLIYFRDMEI